jgi:protein-serine/threonine kinase
MSTHNNEGDEWSQGQMGNRKLTALNDESTYKFEQAKHRQELEGFYWSRDEHEWDTGVDEVEDESSLEAELSSRGSSLSLSAVSPGSVQDDERSVAEEDSPVEIVEDILDQAGLTATIKLDATTSLLIPSISTTPTLSPTALSETVSSMQLSSPVASPERLITPDTSNNDVMARIEDPSGVMSPSKMHVDSAIGKQETLPTIPPRETLEVADIPVGARILQQTKPIPIPAPLIKPDVAAPRLPSGLPASGLSSSDVIVVSTAPPGIDGPRFIRRHPHITSMDSAPAARISVDLHGTITQLGEDDWEAVEIEGQGREFPSAPNGYGATVPPSSFFGRLRRRPSTLITSGLRRTTQHSSDSSSRESSPTKGVAYVRPVFGGGSNRPVFQGTKRVIGKLKVFPLLRSRRNSDATPNHPDASCAAESPSTYRVWMVRAENQ